MRLGQGGLSQNAYCKRVVDLCGVDRNATGFSDRTIMRKAYALQGLRGG